MSAPSAPLNPTAIAMNGGALVFWQLPASNGGSQIGNFTITATPGGTSFQVPFLPLRFRQVFWGLTNSQTYTFAVTATNSDGTSPAGTTNVVMPPGLPGTLPIVFGALQAQMAQDYSVNNLGAPPEFDFGKEYVNENAAGNRTVFFPEQERPPLLTQMWGNIPGGPKQIGTRAVQVACECWGVAPSPPSLGGWGANTNYIAGNGVNDPSPSAGNAGRWQCLTAGESGETNPFPDNPVYGQVVSDGTGSLTWFCTGSPRQDAVNNYGPTEALFNNVYASGRRLWNDKMKWVGTDWCKHNGTLTALGSVATFRFTIEIPLTDYWPMISKITGTPLSFGFSP